MFSVSTVLGEKASDVDQSCGASAKLPGRRPAAHWTGRGQLNEGVMFDELRVWSLFGLGVCMGECMGVNVGQNVCFCDAILVRRLWIVEKEV